MFRNAIFADQQMRGARAGEGALTSLQANVVTADAADVLTVARISGGVVQYTGFTAGRNLTTDTAANYIAANPWMDIGDSFAVLISITTAFAGTFVAGTGVTLAGFATVPASGTRWVLFTRTGAAAFTVRAL